MKTSPAVSPCDATLSNWPGHSAFRKRDAHPALAENLACGALALGAGYGASRLLSAPQNRVGVGLCVAACTLPLLQRTGLVGLALRRLDHGRRALGNQLARWGVPPPPRVRKEQSTVPSPLDRARARVIELEAAIEALLVEAQRLAPRQPAQARRCRNDAQVKQQQLAQEQQHIAQLTGATEDPNDDSTTQDILDGSFDRTAAALKRVGAKLGHQELLEQFEDALQDFDTPEPPPTPRAH